MKHSKKEIIIEKALEILLYEGVHKLTVKNIAVKMDFVESAIYKYYKSKTDILCGIISHIEEICDDVITAIDIKELSSSNKIYAYFHEWNCTYTEKPYIIPVLFSKELLKVEKRVPEKIQSIIQRQYVLLDSILAEGQKQGVFINSMTTEHLRLIISAPWVLFVDNWFYSGRNFPLEPHSTDLLDAVMQLVQTKR